MTTHQSTPPSQSSSPRGWRFLGLFRAASSRTRTRTLIAVAAAWVPLALLSAFRGGDVFLSFLKDYASQSRFLIVLPVLILAEPQLRQRLALVAHQFETDMVPRDQWPEFQSNWRSSEKLMDSNLVRVFIALLTYATAAFLSQYLNPEGAEFIAWWKGGGGFKAFSPAGTWAFLVSYPILVYFAYLWIWRHLVWARFLRSTTQLNLRSDRGPSGSRGGPGVSGGFLVRTDSLRLLHGCRTVWRGLALRVLNEGHQLVGFRYLALALILFVLLYSVGPYLFFTRTLMQMRRQGMLAYGAFARAVGEQFEKKWLHQADSLTADVLVVPDFSTVGDLYGVVENIDDIRVVPVAAVNLYAIVISTLVPALPVVIAAIPFDTLIRAAMGLLF